MNYDSTQPYCGFRNIQELIADLRQAFAELITVPNHLLPEEFRDNIRGCRTLARLEELCDKRDGMTEHRKLKNIKAENVERYRKQFETDEEIRYDGAVNEDQLYRNMVAFCSAAQLVDQDDIDEENFFGGE